jgi:hypothetical protein
VAGRDSATASDSYSPLHEQRTSMLGATGSASRRLDRLESIPRQTVADVLTAAAHRQSAQPRSASTRRQTPATSCVPGPTKRAQALFFEQYRQIALRRDPPPCQGHRSAASRDQQHQPGAGRARACLPVLARVSPWARPGCGCSRSCAARCSKPHPPTTRRHPTPTTPTASESWPNIDHQREDLHICSFHSARGTPPRSAVTVRTDSGR